MLEELFIKIVIIKANALLVNSHQLPIGSVGIMTIHLGATVSNARRIIPLPLVGIVKLVFANLITPVAWVVVRRPKQFPRGIFAFGAPYYTCTFPVAVGAKFGEA